MKLASDNSHVSAFLDEMLSGPEMVQVQERLKSEPQAQEELRRLQQTVAVLRQLPEPAPPPDFWPRTQRQLRAMARQRTRRMVIAQIWRRWLTAVALLVLVLMGVAGLAGLAAGHWHGASSLIAAAGRR